MADPRVTTVGQLVEVLSQFHPDSVLLVGDRPARGFRVEQINPVRDMDEDDIGYRPGGPRMRVVDDRRPSTVRMELEV